MNAPLQAQMKVAPPSPAAGSVVPAGLLQRQCACGGSPGADGECTACRKKRLQRQSAGQAEPVGVSSLVHEVLRAPGQPLDPATRAFMEPRFGHDFGAVRVHADARAAQSARSVNALAYTVGRNVVFGSGQYAPHTREGRSLMAHELTHVVQQGVHTYAPGANLVIDAADSPAERAAYGTAHDLSQDGVRSAAPFTVSTTSLPTSAMLHRAVRFSSKTPLSIDQWDGGGTTIAGDTATIAHGDFAASAEVHAEADAAGELDNWEVGFLQNDRVTWSRTYWTRSNGDGLGRFLERKLRVPTTPLRDHLNDAIVWSAPGEFADVSAAAGGALAADIPLSSSDGPSTPQSIHGSGQAGGDASDGADNIFQFRQGDNFISFISAHNSVTDEWRHLELIYWSVQDSVDFAPDPAGGVTTTRDDHVHGRSRRFRWSMAADQPAIGATLANTYVNNPANTTVRRVNGWT
jgi:hypothetical protein